ncbi:MAG: hypothetical protein WC877_01495 [Dehalococcoidales bacterium]|jgi:hypothetical protein
MVNEKYVITFTGYDDEKIKITYQETGKDGFQSFTVPKENQYNKLIVEYLNKFKLFQ